jgi:pimeloyl-ACP methyl ester carboxylesterase
MPKVAGVEHRFVDAGDLRMHVAETGSGEPVVLLHTSFAHWYAWRHVMPALAERYRVIAPDLRGCGWTAAPPGGYEKETMANDVLALMEALELKRVRLVGHGLGGLIGFLVALRAPERLRRYLAIGIAHPWPRLDARFVAGLWRGWYQVVVSTPVVGALTLRRGHRLLDWVLAGSPDTEEYRAALREAERARATSLMYRTFLLRELVPLVRGRYRPRHLQVPTLMLLGTRDRFFPPHTADGYQPYAEDARVELLPDEGHYPHEANPEQVIHHAMRFFDSGQP